MNFVASSTRIGTGTLKDHSRTANVREKTNWHITVGLPLGGNNDCRHCRHFQIQGSAASLFSGRTVVCLLTSTPTKKRATCCMFQPGSTRLYEESAQ